MSIDARSLELLELPQVLSRAAGYAAFSRSRELVSELEPATSRDTVGARLRRTSEARRLLSAEPSFSVGSAHDVREAAGLAERGARLDPPQLRTIGDQLGAVRRARRNLHPRRMEIPDLWRLVSPLEPLTALERRIDATLDEGGGVRDTASNKLASIRAQLRRGRADLELSMQRLVQSASARRFLQAPIVTQRAGRLVVPVKEEHRSLFGGIVHDVSASGATLFMEPNQAIEVNNQLRELEAAERHEIERVLVRLSAQVGGQREAIAAGVEGLAELDVTLALARYAEELNAVAPSIARDGSFSLKQARHPLLTGEAVPIDVELRPGAPDGFSALIVTGPNTGGKTVALKTVGLLHLMAACGMHLPAAPGSVAAVYGSVLADVGDEQSIDQSLSTFSSHMRNLVAMIQRAGPGVLLLADELGAGTDPGEGAALAQVILRRLLDSGAAVMVTTHHPELRTFAYNDPRARNASVEFNIQTLQPTYRLVMGAPGRSNALAIAQRLGLDPTLIAAARNQLDARQDDFEDAISAIHLDREAAARAREQAEAAARAADAAQAELDARLAGLESERHEILRDTRRKARRLVAQAQELLRAATSTADSGDRQRRSALRDRLRKLTVGLDSPEQSSRHEPAVDSRPPAVGDRVELENFSAVAEVTAVHERDIEVRAGSVRTRVPTTSVLRVAAPEPRAPAKRVALPTGAVPSEINVRGERAAEVSGLVDAAMDRALLSGMSELRVIHGKGTGALRRAVREHVSGSPVAATASDAPPREGGDGVTVIRFEAVPRG